MISTRPCSWRRRNAEIKSRSIDRNNACRRLRRTLQNCTSGSSAASPPDASDAAASSHAVSRWAKNASISRAKAGLASWFASTGVNPIVTGAAVPSEDSSVSRSSSGRYVSSAASHSQSRSEEHTSELQSRLHLVCRLLLEKKKKTYIKLQHS